MDNALSSLPNIGETLAAKLVIAEISTPEELINLGSEQAIIRVAAIEDSGACINMLYALEGAIQGIRWHNLPQSRKAELREFYRQLNK